MIKMMMKLLNVNVIVVNAFLVILNIFRVVNVKAVAALKENLKDIPLNKKVRL